MAKQYKEDDHHPYPPQVARLLQVGEAEEAPELWLDYGAEFGLTRDDVPELLRLALDNGDLNEDAPLSEAWGQTHAMRALAQLQAVDAIGVLLDRIMKDKAFGSDDILVDDMGEILIRLGPAILPTVAALLAEPETLTTGAIVAVSAVGKIGKLFPECRATALAVLRQILEGLNAVHPAINGFAVSRLIDLKGVEAIDVVREAFARNAVDPVIVGDLEDVEIAFGLRQERATPKPNYLGAQIPMLTELARLFNTDGADPPPKVAASRPTTPAAVPRAKKVGRNDPCPCGSGKKYKKCCLDADVGRSA